MTDAVDQLNAGLAAMGFDAASIGPRLLEFAAIVLEGNRSTNLVGADSIESLVAPHLLDSLAPFAGKSTPAHLIDVGSGAGLPAIPLALVFASAQVTLLEPREKRFRFLESAIERMRIGNATVQKVTSESAGRGDLRETADVVTVRAVAHPSTALELGGPLVEPKGRLLLYIGRQTEPTNHELGVAAEIGLELEEATGVEVPYLQGVRHAWWFRKKKRTPSAYPRRAKLPSKEPL